VQNLSRGGLRRQTSCLVQTEGFEQLGPFGAETHTRPKGADRVSFIFSWDNDDVKTEETRRTLPVCFRPLLLRCRRCLRSTKPKAYLDWRPPVLSRGHMNPSTRWAPNCWCKFGTEGGHQHHSTLLLRRGKNQGAPSEDYTFFHYYCYLHLYLYYYCS
jgi:hypothetical protein